jgi:Transposase DNA-binding/Transposase DDE domain
LRAWAKAQWGSCTMGNTQRDKRAVEIGMRMAGQPDAGLPEQMGSSAMLKGAYRLLNCRDVSIEAIWEPHHAATRAAAGHMKRVLFIQDTTTLDYSHHPKTQRIGPVGSRQQRGMLLHSVLVYGDQERQIVGLAHGQVIVRPEQRASTTQKKHNGGTRSEGPEGRVWEQAALTIGPAPAGSQWIHVSDRESDVFEYMSVCRRLGKDFVIRAFHNRKIVGIDPAQEEPTPAGRYLMTQAREAQTMTSPDDRMYAVEVAATTKRGVLHPKRTAQIRLAWLKVHLPAPSYVKDDPGLAVWIVRAWEPAAPVGAEAVEWILITSLPVADWAAARDVTQIYECRWLIEDYHMCLKTGCRVEHSQLDAGDDLQRLLGFHALIAVRLMQLRQTVLTAPNTPVAHTMGLDPLMVRLLAAHFKLAESALTVFRFWMLVAQLGGYLGRKSDGPPGWRTIWKGWHHLTDWADGVRLFAPEKCG